MFLLLYGDIPHRNFTLVARNALDVIFITINRITYSNKMIAYSNKYDNIIQ